MRYPSGWGAISHGATNMAGTEAYLDPMLEAVQLEFSVRMQATAIGRVLSVFFTSQQELAIWQPAWPTVGEKHQQNLQSRLFASRRSRRAYSRGGTVPFRQMTSRMLNGSDRSSGQQAYESGF